MPYGYVGPIAQGVARRGYPASPPPESRWVVHWSDHHETFASFQAAKDDFLNFLWFWGDEVFFADVILSQEIMRGWDVARRWEECRFSEAEVTHFDVSVESQRYGMTRLDVWESKGHTQ